MFFSVAGLRDFDYLKYNAVPEINTQFNNIRKIVRNIYLEMLFMENIKF